MDEEDWEELDEGAMEECMVLATQLCTEQAHTTGQDPTTQSHKATHSKSRAGDRKTGDMSNGSLHHVRDSGVSSTRNSSFHHCDQSSNKINGSVSQKKDATSSSYMSRFSDFSTKTINTHQATSTKKPGSGRGPGLVVAGSGSRSSPSKTYSPIKSWPGGDGAGATMRHNPSIKKTEEEKGKLNEKILMMQGEISLLRSELKRKETLLETERLDHCAALEAAEKKGREKVVKQATEADAKLKEKVTAAEKLQGELHFKKREVEELLQRCHRLEQQQQQQHNQPQSQASAPASKRLRIDKNSTAFARDMDSSISSRFDFSRRPVRVSAGVQTDNTPQTEQPQPRSVHRRRLDVASLKGQVCRTRTIATLLSCSASAASQHTSSSAFSSSSPSPALSYGSAGWSLPTEWLNLISQALREDQSVEQRLVAVAVERLKQTGAVATSQDNGGHSRLTHQLDPSEWYEHEVGPALQILQHFKSSSQLNTLQAITAHLSPMYIKEVLVNRRMRLRLLEVTERIARFLTLPIERDKKNLLSSLRECCNSLETGAEAGALLRVTAAVLPRCQLCGPSGECLIGQLCKKVKKLCMAGVDIVKALLDLVWAAVKIASPPLFLGSRCPCSSQLLGTFLWHLYQTLEAARLHSGNKSEVRQVLVWCISVLHHWSSVDTDWWEKVSPFPQYPALMGLIASRARDIKFDRETVELLCDLYEFDEAVFAR